MIGIMSDSHDNLDAIRKAVDAFNEAEVDLVIHAGDMISPFTSKEIKKLNLIIKELKSYKRFFLYQKNII